MNDMMTTIVYIAIAIGVFALAVWGAYWICVKFFASNKYVMAVAGALLLIVLIFTLVYFVQNSPTVKRAGAGASVQLPQYIG